MADRDDALARTRERVLALLQDAGAPLTVDDVATRLGTHANTARFHLASLETDGLVVRTTEERTLPGRPRALFAAAQDAPVVARRSYRLLAEMLSGFLRDQLPDPTSASEAAGAAWGRFLAEPSAPFERADEQQALDALVDRLGRVGFESHVGTGVDEVADDAAVAADAAGDLRLEIGHCPFLEVADRHRDVVCSLHLGLMRGLLEQLRAPLAAESLDPLVEPGRCVAHLRRTGTRGLTSA
jgi:predicted ArsR family transcriptional regulator